jgi:hypothetical protein
MISTQEAPLGQSSALLANIRLGWKWQVVTNTLAKIFTAVKNL